MIDPQARAVPDGFPWRAALLLGLVAVVLRVGTNLSRVDEHSQEAFVRGVLAQAWIDGAPVWPSHAPQIQHLRGSVVMSALAVPCFSLFGPTTFALRLPGLLFHLAGMLFLMLLVHRRAGRRAAVLAGALWVLAPPALAKIAVLAYGDHVESVPFILATAWLLDAWTDAREGGRPGLGFLAGLAAGLGIAWHAQARLGVLAVGSVAVLLAPRRLLRRDALTGLLPGLLCGLLPAALGDWITAQDGLAVFAHSPVGMITGGWDDGSLGKAARLWTADFAAALQYPWPGAGAFTLELSAACAAGLLVAAARRDRAARHGGDAPLERDALHATLRAAAPLAAWALAFTVAYAASRFRIQHALDNAVQVRFVLPVLTLFVIPIAVAAAALWEARHRAAAALVAAPALLLGAAGSLSTIDVDTILREPARRAVFWEDAAPHFTWGALDAREPAELRALELSLYGSTRQEDAALAFARAAADPDVVLALIARHDRSPPELRPLLYDLQLPAFELGAEGTRELPEAWLPWALAQAGRALGRADGAPPAPIAVVARRCRSAQERALFARALGLGIACNDLPKRIRGGDIRARVLALPPGVEVAEVAFGIGLRTGRIVHAFYPRGDRLLLEALRDLPAPLGRDVACGLGTGYRLRFLEPPPAGLDSPAVARLVSLLAEAAPGLEGPFRAGLGATTAELASASPEDLR